MAMEQLTLKEPLDLTLPEAWERFHRRKDHSTGYVKQSRSQLKHWLRCTSNPPLRDIDNGTLAEFRETFFRSPLPSKAEKIFRRCQREDKQALFVLALLKCPWSELETLTDSDRFARLTECVVDATLNEEQSNLLLPATPTFNAVRRVIEATLATMGPRSRGNRYALGYIESVPCLLPADEEEPDVIVASSEEVSAIYEACRIATWPSFEQTGLQPVDLWQSLAVYLYNLASRRRDFLSLEKARIDLRAGILLGRNRKAKKARAQPLNNIVVQHLRKIWHSKSPLMFPFPRSGGSLYETWRAIQREAGIHVNRPAGSGRHDVYGFHELRKTSLTEYYVLNPDAAQAMGGHSSLLTTIRHYVASARREGIARQASEALPQPMAFLGDDDSPTPPPSSPTPTDRPRLRIVG